MNAGQKKPAPFLVAEHPALDALNSRCAPWGDEIEWWGDGAGLLDWLQTAGLAEAAVAERIACEVGKDALDQLAAQARELREWYRPLIARYAGGLFPASAIHELEPLNRWLARDKQVRVIESKGAHVHLRWQGSVSRPEHLLAPLAAHLAELIASDQLASAKNCECPSCTLWFVDTSKNQKRRWCSMAVCGNRAKAAAHRARKSKGQAPSP